jgi:hypothetical protein
VAPVRFVPVSTTVVPEGPEVGRKLATVGALGGGGLFLFDEAAPHAARTRSRVETSSPKANCRGRLGGTTLANPLLTKDQSFEDEGVPGGVSMGYCSGFGIEAQGCVSTTTSGPRVRY